MPRSQEQPELRVLRLLGANRTLTRVFLGACALGFVLTTPVEAQLEVLLRGLDPAPPQPGACGLYRFVAEEPDGNRTIVFHACIESVRPEEGGSVSLRLWSGDSLQARLRVAPALFEGVGGSLLDHIQSIVEIAHGDTSRLAPEDWSQLPGLSRAPTLPADQDSLLGTRDFTVGEEILHSRGRRMQEESRKVVSLGDVQMTQVESRRIESWTCARAPILGIVRAEAEIRSERRLASPVPGVPERGPRLVRYRLELLNVETARQTRGSGPSG